MKPIPRGVLLTALLLTACRPAPPPARHLLLVTVDTLRADALGCYGRPGSTPCLDHLARRGTQYREVRCQSPTTAPSHATLLGSAYPHRHGVRSNASAPVRSEETLLAEHLAGHGWSTAAFATMGGLLGRYGLERGFETVRDGSPRWTRPGGEAVEEALSWIGAQEGPWFCWVHLYEPHAPYEPPPPLHRLAEPLADRAGRPSVEPWRLPEVARRTGVDDPAALRRLYHAEVATADRLLDRLLAGLHRLAPDRATLVAVTSDHGESLGEHGFYFDHSWRLTEPTLRVPLILAGPGVEAGRLAPGPADLIDLAPTLTARLGLPPPPGWIGRDLAGAAPRDESLAEIGATEVADETRLRSRVRAGRKLILAPDDEAFHWRPRRWTAYDLTGDPGELRPLEPGEADRAGMDRLESWSRQGGRAGEAVELDPDERERLAALGYLAAPAAEPRRAGGRTDRPPPNLRATRPAPGPALPPRITWEPAPEARGYRVELVVPGWTEGRVEQDLAGTDLGELLTAELWARTPPGRYRWRVAALDDRGRTGRFTPWQLLIKPERPAPDWEPRGLVLSPAGLEGRLGRLIQESGGWVRRRAPGDDGALSGYLAFGPWLRLPAGPYRIRFDLGEPRSGSIWIDAARGEGEVLTGRWLRPEEPPELELTLTAPARIQTRLWLEAGARAVLRGVEIRPTAPAPP